MSLKARLVSSKQARRLKITVTTTLECLSVIRVHLTAELHVLEPSQARRRLMLLRARFTWNLTPTLFATANTFFTKFFIESLSHSCCVRVAGEKQWCSGCKKCETRCELARHCWEIDDNLRQSCSRCLWCYSLFRFVIAIKDARQFETTILYVLQLAVLGYCCVPLNVSSSEHNMVIYICLSIRYCGVRLTVMFSRWS